MAGIKNVYQYPIFKKKNLHLVQAAKLFTERNLNILDCPTETKIFFKEDENNNILKKDRKIIILGIGSSGNTTKWGIDNFSLLINRKTIIAEKNNASSPILTLNDKKYLIFKPSLFPK